MSNAHGVSVENLLSTLPDYMRRDETTFALAKSVSEILASAPKAIDGIKIYASINELPEELLDILAYDFKVDWWDPNYTIEQKRRTLKDSWNVFRSLGTKHAVETAISAIYSDTTVTEWFEYGGEPYHFTLHIDTTFDSVDPVKHQRVLDRLEFYRNLRSTPYQIEYTASPFGVCSVYAAADASNISGEIRVRVEVDHNELG